MKYCIVNENNFIENIIISNKKFADEIGALPYYDGAYLNGVYSYPPIPNSEIREHEYETRKCIEWNGEMLTIDEANKMYWEYMIENRTDITDELQAKIIAAKQAIREEYPDE